MIQNELKLRNDLLNTLVDSTMQKIGNHRTSLDKKFADVKEGRALIIIHPYAGDIVKFAIKGHPEHTWIDVYKWHNIYKKVYEHLSTALTALGRIPGVNRTDLPPHHFELDVILSNGEKSHRWVSLNYCEKGIISCKG